MRNIDLFRDYADFQFENADIIQWPQLDEMVQWADRVYHLATVVGMRQIIREPIKMIETNILGCERLLHAASRALGDKKIVITSSSSVYGHINKHRLCEEDALVLTNLSSPLSGYAISKIADENLALAYCHSYSISVVLARLFNTIGSRQSSRYGMVVPRFIKQALANQPITIYDDGEQTRSFCDVRDTVVALDLLGEKPETNGQIINVGNDREITINELACLVRRQTNSSSEFVHVPYREIYGEENVDIKRRCPDLTRLYHYTQFKATIALEQTINELITESLG